MPIPASVADLPVVATLAALGDALTQRHSAVLVAAPGAGKTTVVPLWLLDQPWLGDRRIVMLEPRRLAARAVAARMSALLGEPPGATVGYRVRFEARVSARTRIEVVTEGILTRRLQSDPELAGVGLLIFDEFHERSLHADLALALARDAQLGLREDLKLLLMSATLDGERLCRLLDDAPLVSSEGRAHPVAIRGGEDRGAAPARADLGEDLPGAAGLQALSQLTRFYSGPQLDFTVRVRVRGAEVRPAGLSAGAPLPKSSQSTILSSDQKGPRCLLGCCVGGAGPRLSWTAWLTSGRGGESPLREDSELQVAEVPRFADGPVFEKPTTTSSDTQGVGAGASGG